MRSDSRRAQSDCRTFPLHAHDDAAHSNCLSKARAEDGCAARGTFASGCDGSNAKARDGSAGLSRVKCRGVCIKRLFLCKQRYINVAYSSLTTICGEDLFASSCALTFCTPAVSASICFC